MALRYRTESVPILRWLAVGLTIGLLALGLPPAAHAQIVLSDYSPSRPLKVMAIGDSITDDCSVNGAWRQYLQPLLQTNGYPFIFVGRQASTATRTFTQTRHEGYCGSVIAAPGMLTTPVHGYAGKDVYLLKILAETLTNITPDLALVVMGANDIGRARDPFHVATNDMPHLLDLIFSNAPDANIIITKTTTLSNAVFGYNTNAPNVAIYNAALQAMVKQRTDAGQKVFLADMFSAVDYSTMFNGDHLHPNLLGLNAMAKEFLTRIELITERSDRLMTSLIPAGAVWKYSDTGQDLSNDWTRVEYDDTGWSTGPARLGYGDAVVATTLSYGPDPIRKNPTSYFRYSFVVPDKVAYTNLNFRLSRQDGAVVWLNGQEAFRMNMPAGPITFTNRALKRVSGDLAYIFYSTNLAALLPVGTNQVAVELHINSPVIPSLGFDMELLASGYVIPPPSLSVSLAVDGILLSWPVADSTTYALYSSTNLMTGTGWVPHTTSVQTNASQYVVKVSTDGNQRFFRLQGH